MSGNFQLRENRKMSAVEKGNAVNGKSANGRVISALLAGVLALGAGVASAQTAAASTGGWQYEFTPYFWGAGMKGDVQGGSLPKISTDVSISEILDVLDFGLMGAFEVRKRAACILAP